MEVHPVYDAQAGVWATDDGVEAKTLAQLQVKLPGVAIIGYCPNGYAVDRSGWKTEAQPTTLPRAALRVRRPPKLQVDGPGRGRRSSVPDSVILNLRALGATAKEIATKVGLSENTIWTRLSEAKDRGDARASVKPKPKPSLSKKTQWPLDLATRAAELAAKGLTAAQIAEELSTVGVTKNAVVGYCYRHGVQLQHPPGKYRSGDQNDPPQV